MLSFLIEAIEFKIKISYRYRISIFDFIIELLVNIITHNLAYVISISIRIFDQKGEMTPSSPICINIKYVNHCINIPIKSQWYPLYDIIAISILSSIAQMFH